MTTGVRPRSHAAMARPMPLVRRRARLRELGELVAAVVILVVLFLEIVYGIPAIAIATGMVR